MCLIVRLTGKTGIYVTKFVCQRPASKFCKRSNHDGNKITNDGQKQNGDLIPHRFPHAHKFERWKIQSRILTVTLPRLPVLNFSWFDSS